MFWLKSCPNCTGDLYQDRDPFGYYLRCLQCGHEIQLVRRLEIEERLTPGLLELVNKASNASRKSDEKDKIRSFKPRRKHQ